MRDYLNPVLRYQIFLPNYELSGLFVGELAVIVIYSVFLAGVFVSFSLSCGTLPP